MKKVFFIGIGGIGVSALARYYLSQGWEVFGSDLARSEITDDLKKIGARIFVKKNINLKKTAPDLAIYSLAAKNNPELRRVQDMGVKIMSYPQALGELTKKYRTVAVAGAHGKSTVTAMIGMMLAAAKFDPTVVVGTKVKSFKNTNFRSGKSDLLVIEACEYDRAFWNYFPDIAVVTNIEMDHIECYENEANLRAAFEKFAGNLKPGGKLLVCAEDDGAKKLGESMKKKGTEVLNYSRTMPEAKFFSEILRVPGEHNVTNALAALAVGRMLEIDDETIFKSLAKYRGSWRRFDRRRGEIFGKKITVVLDYGHHPTQIKLTMAAARQLWPKKRIICVFQPHQAWRTSLLFDDFAKVFRESPLDKTFITDIYRVAGRENEKISKDINSEKLADAVGSKKTEYLAKKQIAVKLKKEINKGAILLVLGAGDIYDYMQKILRNQSCDCA